MWHDVIDLLLAEHNQTQPRRKTMGTSRPFGFAFDKAQFSILRGLQLFAAVPYATLSCILGALMEAPSVERVFRAGKSSRNRATLKGRGDRRRRPARLKK